MMAQYVKCLSHKDKELDMVPKTHIKKKRIQTMTHRERDNDS